jgi:hypothetical protein
MRRSGRSLRLTTAVVGLVALAGCAQMGESDRAMIEQARADAQAAQAAADRAAEAADRAAASANEAADAASSATMAMERQERMVQQTVRK